MAKGNLLTKSKKIQAFVHFQNQQFEDAKSLYRRVCQADPIDAEAWQMLGLANEQLSLLDEAERCFLKVTSLQPRRAENHYNLAKIYERMGNIEAALSGYSEAARLRPDFAEAHINLGVMLDKQGRTEEALVRYREAIRLKPDLAEAHFNLGRALQGLGRYQESAGSYREALRVRPDFAEAYNNLGNISYRQGDVEEAVENYKMAVAIKPSFEEAYLNLGNAFLDKATVDQAIDCFRHALSINPNSAAAYRYLGGALRQQGHLGLAEQMTERALALKPDLVEALITLGTIYLQQGRAADAIDVYRRAGQHAPENAVVQSNLLMTMHYLPEYTPEDMLGAAKAWAARYCNPVCRLAPSANLPDPKRKLRIGYVSADFHHHPVGFFIDSVLANHDKSNCEVYCYYNAKVNDTLTTRLRQHADGWRDIAGQTDVAVAEQIRRDGIDVLVDLSGHTEKNRLLTFALKPAPVQVTWIGYFDSTGLSEIDYIIADRYVIPRQEEGNYVERVVRMPNAYLCFSPPDYPIEPSPLPALRAGRVTLGCFNNTAKLTEAVIKRWSRILLSIPDAQLLLKHKAFGDAGVRLRYEGLFSSHGISPERIRYVGQSPRDEYMAAYQEVDIGLDPFPFTGCTTTVESLWMGVPVVSQRGARYVSHMAETLLENIGLGECVVDSEEEYIDKVISLASDLPGLGQIRRKLRSQLLKSPLCDGDTFCRDLEAAYRKMWESWCLAQAAT